MEKVKAQEYVSQIMETCDTDKSGKIDYNGVLQIYFYSIYFTIKNFYN